MNLAVVIGSASSRSGVGSPPPVGKTYVAIPTPPVFTDSHTLLHSVTTNAITLARTNGKFELLIGSDYQLFQLNGLSGSYKIKSLNFDIPANWAKLGETGQAAGITSVGATPNVEYYNVIVKDGSNTVKMTPAVSPYKTQLYQNIIVQNSPFAGFLINNSVAGENYGNFTLNFCRVLNPGGEASYSGNTGNEVTTYVGITTVNHFYSTNSGREGLQFNGHADLRVSNVTCINGGLDTISGIGQNNCAQFQNIYTGYMKKSIFWNFRAPLMVATDDFLFEDCFFNWTDPTRQVYLQSMLPPNHYSKYIHVGGTLIFRRCTFYNPACTISQLFRLQGDQRNYIFEDCIFPLSAAGVLYKDERGDKLTYSITVTNPTYTNSPPLPLFGNPPESAYIGYEKVVIDDHWYNRGCGFRTP